MPIAENSGAWTADAVISRIAALRYAADRLCVVVGLPPETPSQATSRDAVRYSWLYAGNAIEPFYQDISGGPALDQLCDAGIIKIRGPLN